MTSFFKKKEMSDKGLITKDKSSDFKIILPESQGNSSGVTIDLRRMLFNSILLFCFMLIRALTDSCGAALL